MMTYTRRYPEFFARKALLRPAGQRVNLDARRGCFWPGFMPLLAGAILGCSSTVADEPAPGLTVIHAGTVLAVPGQAPLEDQSIYLRDGRIVELRAGFSEESGAQVIDLRDAFVLPGLIDLHVHLTTSSEPGGELDDVTKDSANLALMAAANAERTLAAGFTTVLDLGTGMRAHEEAVFALRDAVASGLMPGPRILATGSPLSIPGQSRTAHFKAEVEAVAGPDNVCSGADDCRRVVRAQVKRGADAISFYNTGSLLSNPSPAMTFTEDEMLAIISTAHTLGRKVIADGGNTRGDASGINAALRAGADSIDTVTYPDAETWKLLKAGEAWFVPHLYAVQAAVGDTPETLQEGTMGWLPVPVLEFLYGLKNETPSAVQAYRAGARFAFGSDPGVFPHGDNAREFAELVSIGLTRQEAVATATVSAAAMLGLNAEVGTIEPGKSADIIATSGNPLEDIRQLEKVIFVMKNGMVYRGRP
jgi:imidazolonepropionase-like amidohydrolase